MGVDFTMNMGIPHFGEETSADIFFHPLTIHVLVAQTSQVSWPNESAQLHRDRWQQGQRKNKTLSQIYIT
jgi:hypothetical protein